MTVAEKTQHLQDVCGKWAFVARKVEGDHVAVVSAAIRCHSWFCKKCAGRKARKFAQATQAYFAGSRLSFFTLTAPPTDTPRESVRRFASRWNTLRTRIAEHVKGFRYVRILERQPGTGRAHYHIFVDKYLPHSLLQREVTNAGFGKIYDIRTIHGQEAFYYVLKYLRKPLVDSEFSQAVIDFNTRLVAGSRGFRMRNPDSSRWEILVNLTDHETAIRTAKQYIWRITEAHCRFEKYQSSSDSEFFEFKLPENLQNSNPEIVEYFLERTQGDLPLNPFRQSTIDELIDFLIKARVDEQVRQ